MKPTLTLLAALLLVPLAALHAAEATTMTQIGKGYATDSVNVAIYRMSSLATFQNTQYAAFYDEQGRMVPKCSGA